MDWTGSEQSPLAGFRFHSSEFIEELCNYKLSSLGIGVVKAQGLIFLSNDHEKQHPGSLVIQ
jgi:hypothetical protein